MPAGVNPKSTSPKMVVKIEWFVHTLIQISSLSPIRFRRFKTVRVSNPHDLQSFILEIPNVEKRDLEGKLGHFIETRPVAALNWRKHPWILFWLNFLPPVQKYFAVQIKHKASKGLFWTQRSNAISQLGNIVWYSIELFWAKV